MKIEGVVTAMISEYPLNAESHKEENNYLYIITIHQFRIILKSTCVHYLFGHQNHGYRKEIAVAGHFVFSTICLISFSKMKRLILQH